MKKNLYIILIAIASQLKAQEMIQVEDQKYFNAYESRGKYFKDLNGVLDKFVGNWKYEDNPTNPSKVLYVTFYKVEQDDTGGYFEDYLIAHYKYYENGVEIYNTQDIGNYFIYGVYFRDPQNTNKYHMIYNEPSEASIALRYNFNIEYLPNSGGTPQLQWDVDIVLEVGEGAQPPRIPQHIILTKLL
jgi:hypothetical protein